jgi:hypothetical protein
VSRSEILKAALELPETDRLLLAQELMETIPEESELGFVHNPGFLEELERRANDGSPRIPWEQVQEQLRRQLDQ